MKYKLTKFIYVFLMINGFIGIITSTILIIKGIITDDYSNIALFLLCCIVNIIGFMYAYNNLVKDN